MNSLNFAKTELAAAIARGVSQCVIIGSRPFLPDPELQIFALTENPSADSSPASLAATLETSGFDKQKPSLFLWLGGEAYRTADAIISAFAFIASLPQGSTVVFDYATERPSFGCLTHTALDALASRIQTATGSVKYLIQPQAVAALLRGLGFRQIVDLPQEQPLINGGHLVSAVV